MTILNLQALLIWVHVASTQFTMHLAKGLKNVKKLNSSAWIFIQCSAARREDFREVQIEMDLDLTNFLQHTVVRWLSIGPAVKRILEQWEAVTQFVTDLAKDS